MSDLRNQRDSLERRLSDGWDRIDTTTDPATKDSWETFWETLLHEYESICQQLAKENANE